VDHLESRRAGMLGHAVLHIDHALGGRIVMRGGRQRGAAQHSQHGEGRTAGEQGGWQLHGPGPQRGVVVAVVAPVPAAVPVKVMTSSIIAGSLACAPAITERIW
jgi:hypothetical protein